MKYIRTKDGIYEIDKDISYGGKEIYKVCYHDFSIIGNGLQKADTTEELCDKFVITFNDKSLEPKQFKNFETALEFLKECDVKYNPELKGAIWTEKGLIYVAKMNENGELIR